jgi:iron-sulfur cluster assembly accessory protein
MVMGINFIITNNVLDRIDRYMKRHDKIKLLRIGIKYRFGCSDVRYSIQAIEKCQNDDVCFAFGDLYIIISRNIAPFFNGAVLCWRETPTDSGFKIINPNVKFICECEKQKYYNK